MTNAKCIPPNVLCIGEFLCPMQTAFCGMQFALASLDAQCKVHSAGCTLHWCFSWSFYFWTCWKRVFKNIFCFLLQHWTADFALGLGLWGWILDSQCEIFEENICREISGEKISAENICRETSGKNIFEKTIGRETSGEKSENKTFAKKFLEQNLRRKHLQKNIWRKIEEHVCRETSADFSWIILWTCIWQLAVQVFGSWIFEHLP